MQNAQSINYSLKINDLGKIECRINERKGVKFTKRRAEIKNSGFLQEDVEFPDFWSDTAVNIVASKYFRGHGKERESSLRQLVGRVVREIVATLAGRFNSETDRDEFSETLTHLLYTQCFAFNSPVWFNLGAEAEPQCSACFIVGVEDTMESISKWISDESAIFRRGSGSGANISRIRHKNAKLSGGGYASGPMSFANSANYNAGAIKSGGKTRRAAKMLVMDMDHPDIEEFIDCKSVQGEGVAKALIAAGFSANFSAEGGAYELAPWQNANNSVRATDKFMSAVVDDDSSEWPLVAGDGEVIKTVNAKDLMRRIAQRTWECGDPGMQWHDTINAWNLCLNDGEIRASNPCSEYMWLDNTSCNLASFNLARYKIGKDFDFNLFERDILMMYLCLDAIVDLSSYPTPEIAAETKKYRTLGAGYANLGGLLMRMGLAYDSDKGRALAGDITECLTRVMYRSSLRAGAFWGAFPAFERNKEHCDKVMWKHGLMTAQNWVSKRDVKQAEWNKFSNDIQNGTGKLRNAQATVLAPTGTIGFMMDVDTTGIEPELALVKYKTMVGGGVIKLVNEAVRESLETLGYAESTREEIVKHIAEHGHAEGSSLTPVDMAVFDCSFLVPGAKRAIKWKAHLDMMAAAQPWISGAISKTINMPEDCSVEDIEKAYIEAWRMGLKAVAIYRDNCKQSQPLSTKETKAVVETKTEEKPVGLVRGEREPLRATRQGHIHKFTINGQSGYLIVGFYPDGRVAEVFAQMNKEGSTIAGFLDSWCRSISLLLQYGVRLEEVMDKFTGSHFEPSGWTQHESIKRCTSVVDYIARYLVVTDFHPSPVSSVDESKTIENFKKIIDEAKNDLTWQKIIVPASEYRGVETPKCHACGGRTKRAGACYLCEDCGTSTGCG